MTFSPAGADALRDEIAPTGKLRVAIAISPAGGAFWSTKTENGFAGVPVDLGREMAAQLGVPVEYIVHNNSGQIVDASPAPDIDWVARLGLLADPADSPPRPTYLKPADATPQQNGQIARL